MIIEIKYDTKEKTISAMQDGQEVSFDGLEIYKDYDDEKKFHLSMSKREHDKDNGIVRHMTTYASCENYLEKEIQKRIGF